MSLPKEKKPETHYTEFGVILIVVTVLVIIVGVVNYYNGLYNQDVSKEETVIQNFNCDQLWVEDDKYFKMDAHNAEFYTVRDKWHNQCLKPLFGYSEPNTEQQDAYFLSLSCADMRTWIKEQKTYYDRAEIDFKEMCHQ